MSYIDDVLAGKNASDNYDSQASYVALPKNKQPVGVLAPGNIAAVDKNGNQTVVAVEDAVDENGLPAEDPYSPSPLASVKDPNAGTNAGFFAEVEEYGSEALDAVKGVGSKVFTAAGNAVTTGYGAVKTVGSDLVNGAEGVVGFGTNQIILIVAVLGVALYFIGTTGAIKISR